MWIQPNTGNMKNSRFALGYVNNKSCRSYKILRCWDCYDPNDKYYEFEIYDISSGSWRGNNDDNVYVDCFIRPNGVSLKGNTYWLATEEPNKSFVREETLSVLQKRSFTSKMEMMWVANIIDSESVNVLFSLTYAVDLHIPDTCFPVYETCFIDKKEKKVAACCNASFETSKNMGYIIGEGDECTKIPYVESTNNSVWSPFVFNYVPSLVQIQQSSGKRKERN